MNKQGGSTNILNALVENRIREIVREEIAGDRAAHRPPDPRIDWREMAARFRADGQDVLAGWYDQLASAKYPSDVI